MESIVRHQALDIDSFDPNNREHNVVYLASASPRRFELIQQMGITPITVSCRTVDESPKTNETAREYVQRLAEEKAFASLQAPDRPLIAADTAVVCESEQGEIILGKPTDEVTAREMLQKLSGNIHKVMTGVCVRYENRHKVSLDVTEVQFAELTDATIDAYLQSGEGSDKAGGYAIQGRAGQFVQQLIGSYSNVVGLPMCLTRLLLQSLQTK